jgi:hypothetical protein
MPPASHLKGVVLRRDLLLEVRCQDGNLQHDVVADLGDLGEEEEGEETSDTTESASKDTAVFRQYTIPRW